MLGSGRRGVSESWSQSLGCELMGSLGRRAWARTLDTAWQQGTAGGYEDDRNPRPLEQKMLAQ
jgi:hypothetical protein